MKITQSELKELLHYDPDTGVFRYRQRGRHWFKNDISHMLWNGKHSGKVNATRFTKGNGYTRVLVSILNTQYMAHRLAWFYMTGEKPPKQIDHINRDATDNRWVNLRDGSELNQRNKSMQRNNKSGITGVSWSKVSQKWQARVWCTQDGKKVYKHLGLFLDKQQAGAVVEEFRRRHQYHPEHGKKPANYI